MARASSATHPAAKPLDGLGRGRPLAAEVDGALQSAQALRRVVVPREGAQGFGDGAVERATVEERRYDDGERAGGMVPRRVTVGEGRDLAPELRRLVPVARPARRVPPASRPRTPCCR